MERRDVVLRQALGKNADETERWQAYKADNETAIKNLDMFSKQLTVEVMVPIGKKAFMPGQLIHTNELLVGHYQGYFSACSAHKAKEICQHRLGLAEEHLKKLEVEAELWQNKLEKPLLEGAMPNAGEIEIVEAFEEEAHNTWLEQHKESLRKQKQEEREYRESLTADEDPFKTLNLVEMMEELGLDPASLNEQSNQVKTPQSESEICDKEAQPMTVLTDEQVFDILDKLEAQEQHEEAEIQSEEEENLQSTSDLVRNLMQDQTALNWRPRFSRAKNEVEKPTEDVHGMDEDDEDEYDDNDPDQPEEVKLIRQQLAQLPIQQQQEFLLSQLQIIKSKMRKIQKEHFISDELTHLMNVVVCLEDDLQDMMFAEIQAASADEQSDESESLLDSIDINKKRRISFAATDEELIFRKEETVAQMLSKQKQQQSREVISLDAPLKPLESQKEARVKEPVKPVTSQIMQKVEQNLQFVKEHQSVQDFDLVNQILEASTGRINTLHISVKHSNAVAPATECDEMIPGNPADIYNLYKKTLSKKQIEHEFPIYVNSFEGEEELKVPILKEEARKAAYDDPRAQFSKFPAEVEESSVETKSILRNKSAVELETRAKSEMSEPNHVTNKSKKNRNKKKKPRTIDDELRDMSAYQKVMHDLVEKEATDPEPLPEGKYIDAHAPKKRISRFKEQRSMNKT
ncbi:unconventional prefoldin RPB5 interactor-like protein [Drosophila innubila]|uniref:unconventional prefoldin RPB5 interactor-like protein n=1 Tax=Drosophila innubila TaxID=198719 RepID=UPI00148D912D|nr:unconventional prefoldin RPB5 interactor-like protein [Drosophila innubila]